MIVFVKVGKLVKKEDGSVALKEVGIQVPKHVIDFKNSKDVMVDGTKLFQSAIQSNVANWELIRLNDERTKLGEWLEAEGSELDEKYASQLKKWNDVEKCIELICEHTSSEHENDTFSKVVAWLRGGSYKGSKDCPISFNGQIELYKALKIHYNLYEGLTTYSKERLASQKALKELIETFVNARFVTNAELVPYYKNIRFKCNDKRLHMILNAVYSKATFGKNVVEDKYATELDVASQVFLHAFKSGYQEEEVTATSGIVM